MSEPPPTSNMQNQDDLVIYRPATEADLPAVAAMYDKLDTFLRRYTYTFPQVENVGTLWLDIFRRTLGRFSVVYIAEYRSETNKPLEMVGFILARVKRVPEYLGGVMVGELKDMWVEPKVRRLGIGEELLRLAIGWCKEQQVYSLEAQLLVGNETIKQLVETLGMKVELYQMRLMWEDYHTSD
ncbi:MAG: GNAT family N-acetyltransferase [Anaerolineales bacterium]|nr:GNAT family N-acetyltransferase [Anaerolineales bacterium]